MRGARYHTPFLERRQNAMEAQIAALQTDVETETQEMGAVGEPIVPEAEEGELGS